MPWLFDSKPRGTDVVFTATFLQIEKAYRARLRPHVHYQGDRFEVEGPVGPGDLDAVEERKQLCLRQLPEHGLLAETDVVLATLLRRKRRNPRGRATKKNGD